jgi:NAD(P)-dependent dehydrogenase (short-subunit alcohol dehydrogenase family)
MITETSKVAIVTGASGGIGAAVAERLAKDGFTVVVNYAGNAASAQAVVARIEAAGGRAVAAQADISDVAAVARMFDSAETAFSGVDVLINNAGIMNLATIKDSDDALFDRHIAVNLKGHVQHAARGGPAPQGWRPDRQFIVERNQLAAANVRRLCRHQGCDRSHDQHSR